MLLNNKDKCTQRAHDAAARTARRSDHAPEITWHKRAKEVRARLSVSAGRHKLGDFRLAVGFNVRCTKVFGRCDGWPYSSRSHCTNRSRFLHICIHQHHIIHSLRGLQIKRTVLCAGAHEGACRRGEQECRRFQHPGCVISQSVTQVSVLTTGVTNNVTLRRQSTYVLRQLENRLASNVSFLGVVLNFHIDDMD